MGFSTLRARSEFQRVYDEGVRFSRNGLGFCVRKAEADDFRFGIAVSKRYGNAVRRNRLRRQIKEIIRLTAVLPTSVEVVLSVYRPCKFLDFVVLRDALHWGFARMGKIKAINENR